MFLGINTIYTPVYLPLCEYGQNQPSCADVGLLLNMALTCSFHSLVWAILRSNPPSLHVGWFLKIYPSDALGVYFPIYTPRSIYRSVYLILYPKAGWNSWYPLSILLVSLTIWYNGHQSRAISLQFKTDIARESRAISVLNCSDITKWWTIMEIQQQKKQWQWRII